jgi:putative endonuclease
VQSNYFYVYILTNITGSVLYTGMASDLAGRIIAHKQKYADGFTKKYKVNLLVYYELAESKEGALFREKQIKDYSRKKKLDLINRINPEWKDLSEKMIEKL